MSDRPQVFYVPRNLDLDSAVTWKSREPDLPEPDVQFVVYGEAATAGSKRGFYNAKARRVIITDDSAKSRPWKAQISDAAVEAMGEREPLNGPLELTLTFYIRRPKSHFGSGKKSQTLKESAPARPIVRPDVLKYARAVEDALSKICYGDDSQIVDEHLHKRYTTGKARVEVSLATVSSDLSLVSE
jgi:Holliday junction resolvase RusA-like endonuclease